MEDVGGDSEPRTSEPWKKELHSMFGSLKDELIQQVNVYLQNKEENNQENESNESEDQDGDGDKALTSLTNYLSDSPSSSKPSNLDDLIDEFTTNERPGPAINEKLATMVEELIRGKLPKSKLDELVERYPRPENCPLLVTPKINKAVWSQLKPNARASDKALQKAQQCYIASISALLTACEKATDDVKTSVTHGLVLALAGNHELNLRRREQLRPEMNSQFASLCNPSTPISSQLFGDDLSKEIDEVTKANKLSKKIQGNRKPKRKGYHPYSTSSNGNRLNFRDNSYPLHHGF